MLLCSEHIQIVQLSNMKWIFLGMLSVATLLSVILPAKSNQLNNFYESCYKNGNVQSCAALGILCGEGNSRACNLVNTATQGGIAQINYYCRQRNNTRACNFLALINQSGGPRNLGRFCRRRDRRACNALSVIACYASENARAGRGPRCTLLSE